MLGLLRSTKLSAAACSISTHPSFIKVQNYTMFSNPCKCFMYPIVWWWDVNYISWLSWNNSTFEVTSLSWVDDVHYDIGQMIVILNVGMACHMIHTASEVFLNLSKYIFSFFCWTYWTESSLIDFDLKRGIMQSSSLSTPIYKTRTVMSACHVMSHHNRIYNEWIVECLLKCCSAVQGFLGLYS